MELIITVQFIATSLILLAHFGEEIKSSFS